jgi:uncharacterized integral membrane protein (TIGR00698 family)
MEIEGITAGINFCAKTVLRIGVALLGVRITINDISSIGYKAAIVLGCGVCLTILLGIVLARLLKCKTDEGILTGASVGICGASAALAVASILPQTKENERFTLMTIVGVTLLSTVAMVCYPIVISLFTLNPQQQGVFLGGTIHDVAQVVAAGMILGQQSADSATIVKLFRVMLLMPIVLCISFFYSKKRQDQNESKSTAIIPTFLLFFILFVALSSFNVFDKQIIDLTSEGSRWCLVFAISAAGIKTNFKDLILLGWAPVVMLLIETAFIATFVLAGIYLTI